MRMDVAADAAALSAARAQAEILNTLSASNLVVNGFVRKFLSGAKGGIAAFAAEGD
jgi:hypothetical protein